MNSSDFDGLASLAQVFALEKIFVFFLGVLILILVAKILKKSEENLIRSLPSKRLLILQIITIVIFLVYIIGTMMLFYGVLNPSKELMLALGGSTAVALGLALKDIVSSLISGLVLLFDQPFQVGDRVTFNGEYGEIKSIGLRTVRLQTLDDNLVTIPNSRFLSDVVASGNSGKLNMMVVSEFHIAIDANIERAKEIIEEVIVTSKYSYLKKPVVIVVNESNLGNLVAIKLKAKAYVMDVNHEQSFRSELTERVKEWFEEEKIKRPLLSLSPLV
jgi:small-conductance mechanosensitive channel